MYAMNRTERKYFELKGTISEMDKTIESLRSTIAKLESALKMNNSKVTVPDDDSVPGYHPSYY